MRRDTSIVLVVDTLEYLKRGGRIGAATAFLGTLLHTKPVLAVMEGEVRPVDRVRTRQKALACLMAEFERKLNTPDQPVQAGVMHVAAEAEMEKLTAMLKDRFNITRFYTSELGPVIGAHVGPGTVGAGICPEPPAEGQR
jgi:DegV family protein with EDD domain